MPAENKEWNDVDFIVAVSLPSSGEVLSFRARKARVDALFLEIDDVKAQDLGISEDDEIVLEISGVQEGRADAPVRVVRIGDRPGTSSAFMGVKFLQPLSDVWVKHVGIPEPSSQESAQPFESPDVSPEDHVQFIHLQPEDVKELVPRLLEMSPANVGSLSDFEQIVRNEIMMLTATDRELIQRGKDGELPEDTPEFLEWEILLLSLQIRAEATLLRKVSRATSGILSVMVENVIAEFRHRVANLEQRVSEVSTKLLSSPETMEAFKGLSRKQGALDSILHEFQIFHFSQVLRDTQKGSHPRPLEELSAIQPRSIESYIEMLGGDSDNPARKRRRRPELLNDCIKLYDAWEKELKEAKVSSEVMDVIRHGLALAGKIAVEARGMRMLFEGADHSLFVGHMRRLAQQDDLAYGKFAADLKRVEKTASGLAEMRLRQTREKTRQAYVSLTNVLDCFPPEFRPQVAGHVRYEISQDARRAPSKEEVRVPKTFLEKTLPVLGHKFVLIGATVFVAIGLLWLAFNLFEDRTSPIAQSGYQTILPFSEVYEQRGRFVGVVNQELWRNLSKMERTRKAQSLREWAGRNGLKGLKLLDENGEKLVTTGDGITWGQLIFWEN